MGFTHRQLRKIANLPNEVSNAIRKHGIDPLLVIVIQQPDVNAAPNDNDAFDGILWGGEWQGPQGRQQLTMIPVDVTTDIRVPANTNPTDIKIEPKDGECVRMLLPGNTAAIHVRVGRWFWA